MEVQLPVLTTKTLPVAASLSFTACCPTRDLLVLSPPGPSVPSTSALPDPPPPAVPKLALWRTTTAAESVWEWTPRPPASANPAPAAPLTGASKFAAFKGKAKETATGKIRALAWNPQGSFLAVAVSSTNAADSAAPSSFSLLSVQTGKAPLPPTVIPTRGHVSFMAWHSLQYDSDPLLKSFARALIEELPRLPPLEDKEAKAAAAASATGAASGMFQAKNAALAREREKEAGRPLDLVQSAAAFPSLLPRAVGGGDDEDDTSGVGEVQAGHSVLLVGDEKGALHLYLAGSVLLGSVFVEPGCVVVEASILPSSSPNSFRLAVLTSPASFSPDPKLSSTTLTLSLPRSLEVFVRQSTELRSAISHAFEALQEARSLWDECRRVSKAWLLRLTDLGKSHAETNPPVTQLLLLLVHGRPTKALHDFLASKMNERVLAKVESSTASALEKLRQVTFMAITPAMEHVVLLLDEMKTWAAWPEKFAPFQLETDWIENALEVVKEIIRTCAILERLVVEEEKCFNAFSTWIRYELDKLSQQEGADLRPSARFQPIPVMHYLRHCLPESSISPYLAFGSSQAPLSANVELKQAEQWYDGLQELEERRARQAEYTDDIFDESLDSVMKRLKEELKGQESGTLLGKKEEHEVTDWEKPARSSSLFRKMRDPPTSLAILLHLLASKVGAAMDTAMKRIGEGTVKGPTVAIGPASDDGEPVTVRQRCVKHENGEQCQYSTWIVETTLWIYKHTTSETACAELQTESQEPIEVVDFGFLDDEEIAFAIRTIGSAATSYALAFVPISSFDFADGMATPMSHLPISRSHVLDAHFPPEGLALNGNSGRRVACVLAGDGRRLEVLDVDSDEPEGGEDISMG